MQIKKSCKTLELQLNPSETALDNDITAVLTGAIGKKL